MTIKRNAPQLPERQSDKVPFSFRSSTEVPSAGESQLVFEGLALVYDYRYDVYGGPASGYGWTERIAEGAFDETLAEDPDVVLLLNHEGMPLARTKSGTLTLSAEEKGLTMGAGLDLANPLVQTLASGLERGDVDEMSFAFRVTKQEWEATDEYPDDEMALRTITGVNLNRGDVSAVTFGASDATEIDIIRSLETLGDAELAEARAVIERRQKQTDGTSGEDEGGMPPELLELLRIQPNPVLQRILQ